MAICFSSSFFNSNINQDKAPQTIVEQFKRLYPIPNYYIPSNVLLWLEPDSFITSEYNIGVDSTLQYGSNIVVLSNIIDKLRVGMYVMFGVDSPKYLVAGINGVTITLTTPITIPNGIYPTFLFEIVQWLDNSDYNRNITGGGSSNRPFLGYSNQLQQDIAVFVRDEYLLNLTPIDDFYNSSAYVVIKEQNGSENTIFSTGGVIDDEYVMATTISPNGAKTYYNNANNETSEISQNGGGLALYKLIRFEYGFLPLEIRLGVAVNGDIPSRTSSTITIPPTQSVFGKIGTSFSTDSGLEGELVELIIMPSITDIVRQKVEGYLAWKYNLTSILTPTHPYKNTRPLA